MIRPTKQSEEYYENLRSVANYFLRTDRGALLFCTSSHEAYIQEINKAIQARCLEKEKEIRVLFLDDKSDKPAIAQIESLIKENPNTQGLIIPNIGEIIILNGKSILYQLNFAREALIELNIPLLFWLSKGNLALFANEASDIFSIRARSIVYFEPKVDFQLSQFWLEKRFDEDYRTKEEYEQIQLRIELLEMQLKEAEEKGYSKEVILNDIVLDLIEQYATHYMDQRAWELTQNYLNYFNYNNFIHLLVLANVYSRKGLHEQAIEFKKVVITIYEENNLINTLDYVDLLHFLATSYSGVSKYEIALGVQQKAIQIIEKINPDNELILAQSYDKLASSYQKMGILDKAYYFQEEAINIYIKENAGLLLAKAYFNLASFFAVQGDLEMALDNSLEGYNLARKTLDSMHPLLGVYLFYIASTFNALGYFKKAIKFALQAKNILKVHKKNLLISVDSVIVTAYFSKGKYKKAIDTILQSLKIEESDKKNDSLIAPMFSYLALSYYQLAQYNKAKQAIEKSLEIIKNKPSSYSQVLLSEAQNIQKDINNKLAIQEKNKQ